MLWLYYEDHLSFSLGSLHGYILVSWHPSENGQISLYFRYLALTYTIYISLPSDKLKHGNDTRENYRSFYQAVNGIISEMLVIFDQSEGEQQSKVVLNYCDPAIICITLCLRALNLKLIIDNSWEKITASPGRGNTPVVS